MARKKKNKKLKRALLGFHYKTTARGGKRGSSGTMVLTHGGVKSGMGGYGTKGSPGSGTR